MRLNRLGSGKRLLWSRLASACGLLAALAMLLLWVGSHTAPTAGRGISPQTLAANWPTPDSGLKARPDILKTFGQLPLMFEPNLGQTNAQVKFLARGAGYGLYLTSDQAVLSLMSTKPAESSTHAAKSEITTSVLRMSLTGANPHPTLRGIDQLPGRSSYFVGNDRSKWRTNVPQYARVRYEGIYPGVDLVYYGNQGQLEYDFQVAPGADPKSVQLAFDGVKKAALDRGDLVLSTPDGSVRLHAPRVYQDEGKAQKAIDARFVLRSQNTVAFEIGAYDHSRTLVIDPVLSYSTYLGGSGVETFPTVAVDSAFNFYVVGSTTSTDFPQVNSFQTLKGTQNVFIAKFSSTGAAPLLYASYLGGSGTDAAQAIAVDAGFNVYVAGTTTSADFPTGGSVGAFQATPKAAGTHGFVAKLNPATTGTGQLIYSSYLSGSGTDTMSGMTIDGKGLVYLIGITNSTDFPTAPSAGALQGTLLGPNAFFVTKLDPTQTGANGLLYSTYFGGSFSKNSTTTVAGGGIAVDNNPAGSDIFITGGTSYQFNGGANDFPIKNAFQPCLDQPTNTVATCVQTNSALDAFIAKLDPSKTAGAQVIYCTYMGGSGDDIGYGIGLDSAGNAYITGSSNSPEPALTIAPTSIQPLQLQNAGGGDAFVGKVTNPTAGSSNTNVIFSYFSYLGGTGADQALAIAVDSVQGARITGITNSTDLPVSNPVQATPGGGTDAFVARVDTTGLTTGQFVSYLGGSGNDRGTGIAVDSNAVTYVAGETASPNFPTASPLQASLNGTQDAFVSKLSPAVNLTVTGAGSANVNAGNQATFTYTITNKGDTIAGVAFIDNLANPGVASTFVSATAAGGTCPTSATNNTVICNVGVLNGGGSTTVTVVLTPSTAGILGNSGTVIVAGSTFTASASASTTVTSYALDVQPASVTVAAGNPATYTPTITPQGNYTASVALSCPSGLPSGTSCTFSTTPITLSGSSPSSVTLTISTTLRTTTTAALEHKRLLYAAWFPIGGLLFLGLGMGERYTRRRRIVGSLLIVLLIGLVAMQPACSHSSSSTINTGTPAGTYAVTVSATSGSFSQTKQVTLVVQ